MCGPPRRCQANHISSARLLWRPTIRTSAASSLATIRRSLAGHVVRSALHDALLQRLSRDPLAVARMLSAHYPQNPAISYIPAVAWVNMRRVAAIVSDESLAAKV